MCTLRGYVALATMLAGLGMAQADEPGTSLIIEGGGLPAYCPALERLVKDATVNGRIRIGYLATAGTNLEASTRQFIERMKPYGVRSEDIQNIDISVQNAITQAENPQIVEQIRACTAIFFGGGDQTRITRALRHADGSETAALSAIYAAWKNGTIIAGSSAGAAVQSEIMMAVSGVPDDSTDEGMHALDFGLTKAIDEPARRGLLISRGLGFLRSGIVDQHFTQFRGRLGRLARAATEEHVRYGFGIDEDAALLVTSDGMMEVLGPGHVTIVDTEGASIEDGPLGCHISKIHLTCLAHGDRFDPKSGEAIIHASKKRIERGRELYNGNFLIPDISGRGAVILALFGGLGNNTRWQQDGVALKHHGHLGHGYRFRFTKTEDTECFEGTLQGVDVEAVTQIRLDIEPVTHTLRSPEHELPIDIPDGQLKSALGAIWFRNILLPDQAGHFRTDAPITRAEFASAISQAILLEPPRGKHPVIQDLPQDVELAHDVMLVVAAGLMETEDNAFRPADTLTRETAATTLVRLYERYRSKEIIPEPIEFEDADAITLNHRNDVFAAIHERILTAEGDRFRPGDEVTRADVAKALFRILDFPWAR